jgi:hypothetical protein
MSSMTSIVLSNRADDAQTDREQRHEPEVVARFEVEEVRDRRATLLMFDRGRDLLSDHVLQWL